MISQRLGQETVSKLSLDLSNLTNPVNETTNIHIREVLHRLLEGNHKNHDIFFDKAGRHNHAVHHLLAAYSLGASADRLKEIYEEHLVYQRPKPPHKVTISQDNWTQYLGENDMWTDYLTFFDKIVALEGISKAIETYALHPSMFPRLFAGAFHPLIHLGYGVEFQIPIIVSEGLAQMAVHSNMLESVFNEDYWSSQGNGKNRLSEIIDMACHDGRFNNVVLYDDDMKFQKLVEKRAAVLREYAKKWDLPDTVEGLNQGMRELFETCVLGFGATAQRPDKPAILLDFFLMHGLTSAHFVKTLISYFPLKYSLQLLRMHFATVLGYYISRGRPNLYPELLYNYTPIEFSEISEDPWQDVISRVIHVKNEVHVVKVVRALYVAEQKWGKGEHNMFLKTAQLTVDGHEKYGWCFDGIGWDQTWNKIAESMSKVFE